VPRTVASKSKSSEPVTSNRFLLNSTTSNPASAGFFFAWIFVGLAGMRRCLPNACPVLQNHPGMSCALQQTPLKSAAKPHKTGNFMINADPQELQKFSDLAHRWWDPTSEFRPLHEINPLRLEWIHARAGLAGKRVIDIGCGGGILTEAMARKGATVTGIDLSEKALKVADLHSLESGVTVHYEKIAAEDMALREPASFDVVTCMEMLEHVPDPAAIVRACAQLVKPGGHVFFSTLNRNPKSYLFAVIGAEYVLRLLPRGTHDFAKFITPAELGQFMRNASLEVDAIKGLTYNPFTRVYSLNQDTSVNYMMASHRVD
jgi:2-polyprenyl-6-hydroxyphenyl methylase/3-demethylubiquinone-9 3-methyltransferase